jgi:hypothetical protein
MSGKLATVSCVDTSEKAVEKILYTFSLSCVIISLLCAGWADPGKPPPLFWGATKSNRMQARFRMDSESGLKIGKTAACLLCPHGPNLKGVYTFGRKT